MSIFYMVLFYVSLVGIAMLFLLKSFELRTGRSVIPERVIERVEKWALRFFLRIAQIRSYTTKESLAHTLQPIRQRVATFLTSIQIKFNFYFSRVVDMVRGKGTLIKRGRSSNFLNNIAEYKNLDKNEGSHKFL